MVRGLQREGHLASGARWRRSGSHHEDAGAICEVVPGWAFDRVRLRRKSLAGDGRRQTRASADELRRQARLSRTGSGNRRALRLLFLARGHFRHLGDGRRQPRQTIRRQATLSSSKPMLVFERHYLPTAGAIPMYGVAPEGRRFLMMEDPEQDTPVTRLNLVLSLS